MPLIDPVLDVQTQERLEAYLRLLLEANEHMNLTAVTDWEQARVRHLQDSVIGASLLPENAYVADVGTGAGLPGLPLAIVRPDCQFVLADTLKKRVDFLNQTLETLEITNAKAVWIRAEDMGRSAEYREKFDVAVCRALAALRLSLEYLHPLVKPGGFSLYWKGSAAEQEMEDAAHALKLLKAEKPVRYPYRLSGQDAEFCLVQTAKKVPVPAAYPRRVGVPAKNPL